MSHLGKTFLDILFLMIIIILSSCNLKVYYYLVNKSSDSLRFHLYHENNKINGFFDFKVSPKLIHNLNPNSQEKFSIFKNIKIDSIDNSFCGIIPPESVIYIGYTQGPAKIFKWILIQDQHKIDTVTYENLSHKGLTYWYDIN